MKGPAAIASAAAGVACHRTPFVGHSGVPTLRELELERLREMTPAEKLRVAHGLWREARALTIASVSSRHPEWSREEVLIATRRMMSGGRA